MGVLTFKASEQGQAKIKQARVAKGWKVKAEDDTPLREASKFLIEQHAHKNHWNVNDSRWLRDFEQLFRVEKHQNINQIKTIIAKSKQGSLVERIEQLIDTGEVFAKDISYGSWNRFASQRKLHAIKARAFQAYCQVLGLKWQEIVEHSHTADIEDIDKKITNTLPRSYPYHNLPKRYHTALIGREQEMAQLLERLARKARASCIVVEGIGGAGKTSLVLEAAYQCLEASCTAQRTPPIPHFDAIIFTSAKQQHLIGNHILQRHKSDRTMHDIVKAIFRTLECPGVIPADFDQQLEYIHSRLAQLYTLLIVDNIETIEDQEAVLAFLYELPATVKIVITTRVRGAFGVPIYLECLPFKEAELLIQHQAQEQKLQLQPEQFQAIYQRTNGLPLGIVYTIGQLSVYGICADIAATRLSQVNSNLAQYCFEDCVQRLRGKPAHRMLMGLGLFTKSASLEAIAQITLPDANSLNALAQLYKLRLVIQRQERYDLHPLTREYALAELQADSEFEQKVRERWVNWYLSFSQSYAQHDWRQWHEYEDLDQEWENLQAVIDWCIQHNRYEQVRQFWQQIKGYTYLRGYWHERLAWIDWLIQATQGRQDQSMIAEALGDKNWTLALMGKAEHLAEVDALFVQVLNLQQGKDLIVKLGLMIDQAVLLIQRRNFNQAHQLLHQGKDLLNSIPIEEPKRLRQLIRLYYYQAEVWFRIGNYQQAKIGYQIALKHAQLAQWQQVEVYILNWLVDVELAKQGNLDEAECLLSRSLPLAVANKDKRSIAFHKRSWANLAKSKGNLPEFQSWATQAQAEFESLGMLPEAQEIQSWMEENGGD